jgi:hypothetical protein
MIIALLMAAAVASAAPTAAALTDADRAAIIAKTHPVTEPVWVATPQASFWKACTAGYLTDPTFVGETVYMACAVQPNGSLDQCKVRESKRAEAAGMQDVAICAAPGFRIGPLDKKGVPTAGRPILIPLGAVAGPPPTGAPASPAPAKKP